MVNRIFNVNGSGEELLLQALERVFAQQGYGPKTAVAYLVDKEKGLILFWTDGEGDKFLTPLSAKGVFPMVVEWVDSDAAKEIECKGCDAKANADHDNPLGWRVYFEDWGHDCRYIICVVKPAYMRHGK